MSDIGGSPQTLKSAHAGDLLRRQARLTPDAIALLEPGHEALRYADLLAVVEDLCRQLRDFGIEKGHRVALVMPNGSATAAIILGLLECCTLVPLNPDYRRREFESLYAQAGVDAILTSFDAGHPGRDIGRARAIPVIEARPSQRIAGRFDLSLPAGPGPRALSGRASSSYPALVLHTSGSTANPKIVPLLHSNLLASVDNLVESLALSADDRCLNMMPMFHIGGLLDLLLAPVAVGAAIVTPAQNNGQTFFQCLGNYQPSCYQAVPTMLRDVIGTLGSNPDLLRGTRPLRLVRSVSSALSNRLLHEIESRLSTTVIEIYGMTETAGVICSNPIASGRQKQGSVGLPQGCEVRILDPGGKVLACGERGEVAVRGDNVMPGYENRDVGVDQDFCDDFLRTGDEGYFDAEGYLFLCGRIKEVVNRGGEKISPLEIDRVAEMHPAVKAAAAFAIPHPSLGEEVGLAVVRNGRADFDETDLAAHLAANLSPHKLPRRIFYTDRLPRAAGGKLRRHRLRALMLEQLDLQSHGPRQAPRSALARELAGLWEALLEVESVELQDNFFDLGGDSLSAVAMIGELKLRYPAIHASVIYEYPTLGKLEEYLAQQGVALADGSEQPVARAQLSEVLMPFMVGWQGVRLNRDSLIVGRNTEGNRTPLFWCVNGYSEFDALADEMHAEQPVYGMRSLYDSGYKSDGATLQLARIYLDELLRLQARGPYLLGGFCEGGKIAFAIAQLLRQRGETVASLMLQEQFVASPYSGRVAIFVCNPGRNNPYYNFADATRGWRKYYSGDLQLYRINGRHKDCYLRPDIEFVARQVRREMQRALSYRHDDSIDRRNGLQRLPLDAYNALLEARAPTRIWPGSRFEVDVRITNTSMFDWEPTPDSGLLLGAKWLRLSGETRTWMAGKSEIHRRLHPGDSMNLPISIRAPMRLRQYYLEIDLVDDGVAWFTDMGSEPSRHLVQLSVLT